MRIQHTVVFSLIHDAGSAEETAFLDTAEQVLSSIPAVTDFIVCRQVSEKSYLEWQFSMRFSGLAEYEAYNSAPAHVDFVATHWADEVAAFQEYDFIAR
ncbi:Dabb family protein [Microbacterium sp. X-17]|uniref:Dabb family protein n=1 Tax=Microbacterium sp. X-17 TaxID=3144404 RepID=UPI0031F4D224